MRGRSISCHDRRNYLQLDAGRALSGAHCLISDCNKCFLQCQLVADNADHRDRLYLGPLGDNLRSSSKLLTNSRPTVRKWRPQLCARHKLEVIPVPSVGTEFAIVIKNDSL